VGAVAETRPGPPPPPPPRLPKFKYRFRSVWEVAPWILVQIYPRGTFGARLHGTTRRYRVYADVMFEEELPQDTDATYWVTQFPQGGNLICMEASSVTCSKGVRFCSVELNRNTLDCITRRCAPEAHSGKLNFYWPPRSRYPEILGGTRAPADEVRPAVDGTTCTGALALLGEVTDPALLKAAKDRGWEDTAAALEAVARAVKDGADAAATALGMLAVPLVITTRREGFDTIVEARRPVPIRALRVFVSGPEGARFKVRVLAAGRIHGPKPKSTGEPVIVITHGTSVVVAEQREVAPGEPVDVAITPPEAETPASYESYIAARSMQALVHVIPPPGVDKFDVYVTLVWGTASPSANDIEWGDAGGIRVTYDMKKRAPSFDLKPLGTRYEAGGKLVAELAVSTPVPGCHAAEVEVYLPHDPGSAPHRERVEVCGPPGVKAARVQAELRPRYIEPQKWVAARVVYNGKTVAEVSWRMEWKPKAEVEVLSVTARAEGPDPLRPEELVVTADVMNWTLQRRKVKICPSVSGGIKERCYCLHGGDVSQCGAMFVRCYDYMVMEGTEPCAELELEPLELVMLEWRAPKSVCQGVPVTLRVYRRERGAQPAQGMVGPPGEWTVQEVRRPERTWCWAFRLYSEYTDKWGWAGDGRFAVPPDELARDIAREFKFYHLNYMGIERGELMPGKFCAEVMGKRACVKKPSEYELKMAEMGRKYGGCVAYNLALPDIVEEIIGKDRGLQLILCDGRENPWKAREVVLGSPAEKFRLALAFKWSKPPKVVSPVPLVTVIGDMEHIYVAWVPKQGWYGKPQIPDTNIHGVNVPVNLPEGGKFAEVELTPLLFFGGRPERVPEQFAAVLHVQMPWYVVNAGVINPRQLCFLDVMCPDLEKYAGLPCMVVNSVPVRSLPVGSAHDVFVPPTLLVNATKGLTVRIIKDVNGVCSFEPGIKVLGPQGEVKGGCRFVKESRALRERAPIRGLPVREEGEGRYRYGVPRERVEVEYLECYYPPPPLLEFVPVYVFKIAQEPQRVPGAAGEPQLAIKPASGNYAVPPGGRFEVTLDTDAREWELGLRLGVGLSPEEARRTAVEVDLVDRAGRRAKRFRVSGPVRIAFRLPERLPARVCLYLQPLANGLPRDDRTYCFT